MEFTTCDMKKIEEGSWRCLVLYGCRFASLHHWSTSCTPRSRRRESIKSRRTRLKPSLPCLQRTARCGVWSPQSHVIEPFCACHPIRPWAPYGPSDPHEELTIFQPTYPVRLAIKLDVPGCDAASVAASALRFVFPPLHLGITKWGSGPSRHKTIE